MPSHVGTGSRKFQPFWPQSAFGPSSFILTFSLHIKAKEKKTYLNRECNENVPKQINSSGPPPPPSGPPTPPKIKLFFYFCSYLACERILSSDFVCRRLQGIFPLTRISDQDAFKLYNSVSVPSISSTDFSDFPWCFMYVNTLEG